MTVMEKRLELHELLCELLGSRNVYFQPPESVKLKYPAIVYARERIANDFADNSVYKQELAYRITTIDKDPDSELPIKISRLPRCRYDRPYTANNLNDNVFVLYY